MRISFRGPYKVIYQQGSVLCVIQSILATSSPFLAHKSRLSECRTPLTENQTHIGPLQLEEDNFDIAQEEPEDIQGMDPEQCQIEGRISE